MNGTCPIQVVEDRNNIKNRWLTLAKYIEFSQPTPIKNPNGKFKNIIGWFGEKRNMGTLKLLFNGQNSSPMYSSDKIRNPTISEIIEISNILKKNGYKVNLKKCQLIQDY